MSPIRPLCPDRPWRFRLIRLGLLTVCIAWLVVAAGLEPDPRGYGTAEAFLPACGFLANHGVPCPNCGMTTAMAATMDGQFALAWRAQPLGVVLTFLVGATGLLCLAETLLTRRLLPGLGWIPWWVYLTLGVVATLGAWAYVYWTGLRDGRWPI